jgi:hypothetical protein
MSLDGSGASQSQPRRVRLSLVIAHFTGEAPVPPPVLMEIFLFDPAQGFIAVTSSGPLPQATENLVVHTSKRAFTRDVPMIIGRTSNLGVELINQIGSGLT